MKNPLKTKKLKTKLWRVKLVLSHFIVILNANEESFKNLNRHSQAIENPFSTDNKFKKYHKFTVDQRMIF